LSFNLPLGALHFVQIGHGIRKKKEGRPGSFLSFWLQRCSIEKGGNLSRLLLPSSVGWNGLTSFAIFLPFYRFANLSRTGRVFFAGRVLVILFFFPRGW
jgi:hypothetical protein